MCSDTCPLNLCKADPGRNENFLKLLICAIVVFGPLNPELMKGRSYIESLVGQGHTRP